MRYRPVSQGSDGKVGDDFVEVKTITPHKKKTKVSVKRKGNFSKLIVVRVYRSYSYESKVVDRKHLPNGKGGKRASISWSTIKKLKTDKANSL